MNKMYAKRDLRTDYGILRSYSYGKMKPKYLLTATKYKKLNKYEKLLWIEVTDNMKSFPR